MSLADIYRAWMRFLYNVVEMGNALHNDYTLKELTLIADDPPVTYPPVKLQFLLEVHDRFMLNYVEGTTGKMLENLWAATSGICSRNQDVRWINNEIERIRQSQEADTVKRLSDELQKRIDDIIERNAGEGDPTVELVKDHCSLLEAEDKRFLYEMKMALRAGVQVFEEFERDTVKEGGAQLLEIARQIPKILETYHSRVLSRSSETLLGYSDR
jgi:hypothetical protein